MEVKDKITYLREKHTIILSVLIAAIYLIAFKGIKWIAAFVITSRGYGIQLSAECAGIIMSVIIIHLAGKEYIFKEKGKGILKGLFVGGFLVAVCLLQIISVMAKVLYNGKADQLLPLSQVVVFVATMASIGVAEELIFRGTILNILVDKFGRTQKGIYISIAISSAIFGIAHISNVFGGVSVKGSLIQAAGAAIVGAILAAVYLRTKNIWAAVILHALMDFSSLLGSGLFGINSLTGEINSYSSIKLLGFFIYLPVILFLLRNKKEQDYVGVYKC